MYALICTHSNANKINIETLCLTSNLMDCEFYQYIIFPINHRTFQLQQLIFRLCIFQYNCMFI